MTEITIKNFQSVASAKFSVDGFTLIIGKNNIGKSAIIRAINAALINQTGSDFIREGTKMTEVSLTRDGLNIHWNKGTKTSYIVNGQSFTALNRSVPAPVLEAGFKNIETGDLKINPLYAPQFEVNGNGPVFLLNRPGSQVTDILSEVYDINVISNADELCQKEIRAVKGLIKTRTKDQENLEEDMKKFEGFDKIKEDMETLKDLENKCSSLRNETEKLSAMITEMTRLEQSVLLLKKILKVQVPDPGETHLTLEAHKWVSSALTELTILSSRVETLKKVSEVDIPDGSGHEEEIKSVAYLQDTGNKLKSQAIMVRNLKELGKHLEAVSDMVPKVDSIEESIKALIWVRSTHGNLTNLAVTVKTVKNEMVETDKALEEYQKEKSEYKTCPACGGTLDRCPISYS